MGASHTCISHEVWSARFADLNNKPAALKILRLLYYYYNITKKKTFACKIHIQVKFKFKANFSDSVGENGD